MTESSSLQDHRDYLRLLVDNTPKWRPPETVEPLDWVALADREPPPRRYVWRNWLPVGCVTALYAPGGAGKSVLAQQVATMTALGHELWGDATEQRPALAVFAEEDHDELWRRQTRICRWAGCELRNLAGRLFVEGRAGKPNVIATFTPEGELKPGEFAEPLRRACEEIKPGLIVIDNIAQVFAGDENNRSQVTQFVNFLASFARDFDAAVLLVGHTAKAVDSEYSGSTAWNAAVRSRLLLRRDEETGAVKLIRTKSNYAPPAEIDLQWADGVLRAADPAIASLGDRIEIEARQARARQAVLDGLEELRRRGLAASASPRATTYAPRMLREHGLDGGFSPHELADAVRTLLADGTLHASVRVVRGSNRHWRNGLGRPGWETADA